MRYLYQNKSYSENESRENRTKFTSLPPTDLLARISNNLFKCEPPGGIRGPPVKDPWSTIGACT